MTDAPQGYRRGVGILLLDGQNRVFVGRRIDTPEAWQMPQGGIDPGETPHDALFREMAEEIGTAKAEILAESAQWLRYELPLALQGKIWGGRFRGQEQRWFALRFTGSDADIDVATAHPEFDAWRWVPATQIGTLIVPFKRDLYEAVLQEFAPLLGGLSVAPGPER